MTRLALTFPASELGARAGLVGLRNWISAQALDADRASDVEIAVAEAVNNVVEHAYGPVSDGLVCLRARILGEALVILLCDQGAPLPGLEIPDPSEPDLSSARTALPEGGFGWLLIRKLAVALRYRHRAGVNHLMMRF